MKRGFSLSASKIATEICARLQEYTDENRRLYNSIDYKGVSPNYSKINDTAEATGQGFEDDEVWQDKRTIESLEQDDFFGLVDMTQGMPHELGYYAVSDPPVDPPPGGGNGQ